jgi:hypothetical protein
MRRALVELLAGTASRQARQLPMQALSVQAIAVLPAHISAATQAYRYLSSAMPALSMPDTETFQSHTDITLLGPLEDSKLTPRAVVERLDKYIIGQAEAKKAVAVAFRNRWRRCAAPCCAAYASCVQCNASF